jgi:hypothetical protein
MDHECTQGDGKEAEVVLETFLGDETRDRPKGRSNLKKW